MKKNFKISTVILMTLLLVLTACGSDKPNDSNEEIVLRFSYWDNFDEDILKKFEDENPGVKVEHVLYPDGEYSQKINTMLIGKTAPDVIIAFETDLPRFAEAGLIEDLDPYMQDSELADKEFIPAVDELSTLVNGNYGFPWSYAGEFMYYNKDLFDDAGVAYPDGTWTWDDYADAAEKLTQRNGDSTDVWGTDKINFRGIWYSMIGSYGDAVVDAENNIILGEGLEKTLEIENRMVNIDKSAPQPEAGENIGDLFAAGKAAMTRTGSWMTALYSDAEFNWDIAPLPKGTQEYTTLHTGFYTINADSEYKEEAWKFIEFMMSEEGQSMTTKFSHNPSAIKEYAEKGEYQNEGVNGPANWDTFNWMQDYGSFGYVLANASDTSTLIDMMEAYLMGEATYDSIIKEADKINQE